MSAATLVHVVVKPGFERAFLEASLANREGSLEEPGNLRFDVLQDVEDPRRFFLYEVYETPEAARAHKDTAHYLRWRETVAEMMKIPRVGQALQFHGA